VAGERRGEERGKGGRGKESDEAPGERDRQMSGEGEREGEVDEAGMEMA